MRCLVSESPCNEMLVRCFCDSVMPVIVLFVQPPLAVLAPLSASLGLNMFLPSKRQKWFFFTKFAGKVSMLDYVWVAVIARKVLSHARRCASNVTECQGRCRQDIHAALRALPCFGISVPMLFYVMTACLGHTSDVG